MHCALSTEEARVLVCGARLLPCSNVRTEQCSRTQESDEESEPGGGTRNRSRRQSPSRTPHPGRRTRCVSSARHVEQKCRASRSWRRTNADTLPAGGPSILLGLDADVYASSEIRQPLQAALSKDSEGFEDQVKSSWELLEKTVSRRGCGADSSKLSNLFGNGRHLTVSVRRRGGPGPLAAAKLTVSELTQNLTISLTRRAAEPRPVQWECPGRRSSASNN
eukprot:3077582-Rhodomonas_salina.6